MGGVPAAALVFLSGQRDLILERMKERHGHFFRAERLDSQLDTLERPTAEEGFDVSIVQTLEEIVDVVSEWLDGE